MLIFQIRETGEDQRGLTASLGRPFSQDKVEVAELLRELACSSQQQQQQQRCPPREQCHCNDEATISMAVLVIADTAGSDPGCLPPIQSLRHCSSGLGEGSQDPQEVPPPTNLLDLAEVPPATVAPVLGNLNFL